jgi:peptidoglycan/LPS O-acetylase OafA/YrhL
VYVFFAISGFVISRSFSGTRTLSGYVTFLGHRVLRIYPAFLVSLAAAVFILVYRSGSEALALKTLLQNLVFLNGAFALNIAAYNGVTWSLFFEFLYYIVFPLLFLLAARAANPRWAAPLLWLLVILASALAPYHEWFLFLPFLAGACAGLQTEATLKHVASLCPDAWLVGAYLAITTAACLLVPLPRYTPGGLIWPASAPIYVSLLSVTVTLAIVRASYGGGFLHRFLTTRPLLALGRISFSFFLVHTLVIGIVIPATAPYVNGTLGSAAALGLATLLLACVPAAILYEVAEKPYYAFRRHFDKNKALMPS